MVADPVACPWNSLDELDHQATSRLDLNSGMVALAKARAEREGFSASTKFLQWSEDRLPFDDATFERVICKSVLEYVADPSNVIEEFKRVTQPRGRVHIIDSDWSMMVLEPVGADKLRQLFNAASMAYNTPEIGRQLYGLMRHAGLTDVSVKVLCAADTAGVRAPVVRHMVSYAREANTIDEAFLTAISKAVEDAIHDQTYLMILPTVCCLRIVAVTYCFGILRFVPSSSSAPSIKANDILNRQSRHGPKFPRSG